MKKHKWHKEIKAWADGDTVEWSASNGKTWFEDDERPNWANSSILFRIKPKDKEAQYLYVYWYEDKIKLMPNKFSNSNFDYLGKIKLEVEDGN